MLCAASRAALRRLGPTVAAVPSRTLTIRLKAPISQAQANCAFQGVRQFASVGRPKASTKSATTKAAATKKTKAGKAAKPKAKKKAATKPKPKPAKKTPKPKAPETLAIEDRRQLKRIAILFEPKTAPESAWRIYVAENLQGSQGTEFEKVTEKMAGVAQAYKTLSASELQRYAEKAEENRRANAAAYKAWVESHTVEEVSAANNARLKLKRLHNYPKGNVKTIKDERAPKHPTSSFGFFTKAKWASGEFSGGPDGLSSTAGAISTAWKNLSAAERQPYEDLARAESARYEKDYEAAYGRKPVVRKRSPDTA
ncbi:uncharacterized protein B0I36DRAFT_90737 [Microdochium trichocladiopsis]|uniref:HMG box domain-containing protein n=1 Tax=Microdochium trichocladiopsis TaxID=1682393 RepID=A0A9P9BSX1_9PEZI|nr:uncharacterized protein B0I36DRAFT_90737 [Microdochium trichocladiopsis]KAH7035295.1 hypothetical protein B0I36DRAFT_90737 [Microdochium trichocladiopsis]